MNGSLLQSKIYYGYAQAANHVGTSFEQYRSPNSIDPIVPSNLLGSLLMSASVNWTYNKFNKYGNAIWQLLVDGRELLPFDFLIGNATFFVGAMQPLLPILGVECNRTVTIKRYEQASTAGVTSYGGYTEAEGTILMQNCPCSILQQDKGDNHPIALPMDGKIPRQQMILPNLPGSSFRLSDIVIDDRGVRSNVLSVELSDLGWRFILGSTEN